MIYFSKHSSIGPLLTGKEVLKNIERLNKINRNDDNFEDKKQHLARFYQVL